MMRKCLICYVVRDVKDFNKKNVMCITCEKKYDQQRKSGN